MRKIIVLLLAIVLSGCGFFKDTKNYTFGWGPIGPNYEIRAGEFYKGTHVGKSYECDDACKKIWEQFGMDVAMGDLVRRKRHDAGYKYRKIIG